MRCSKLERGAERVMELINFHSLSASEAARLIREGVISSERLMEACLARVREIDGEIQAWAFLDPDYALAWAARPTLGAVKENLPVRCTACR
jgi:Asp-tRNA(Asn)/Glu-tRNA(Gln) amidotransferase A subunit family amidase